MRAAALHLSSPRALVAAFAVESVKMRAAAVAPAARASSSWQHAQRHWHSSSWQHNNVTGTSSSWQHEQRHWHQLERHAPEQGGEEQQVQNPRTLKGIGRGNMPEAAASGNQLFDARCVPKRDSHAREGGMPEATAFGKQLHSLQERCHFSSSRGLSVPAPACTHSEC